MTETILQIEHLSKFFRRFEALQDINLSVDRGRVYGLVGQNGAGKTTLLRLICGLMKPTKGFVGLQTEKTFIGYMPQSCRFDDGSSVADTIRFFARIRKADVKESILLGEKLRLDMSKKIKYLSPGQQKKLQMVIAMTGEPDLYILDEPTAGLDPNATCEMKNIMKGIHDSGKSIILSSHILGDMDEICTDIAIMEHGRLVFNNTIESCYLVKTSVVTNKMLQSLSMEFRISADTAGTTLTAKIPKEEVPNLLQALMAQNINVYEVAAANVRNIIQEQLHFLEEVS